MRDVENNVELDTKIVQMFSDTFARKILNKSSEILFDSVIHFGQVNISVNVRKWTAKNEGAILISNSTFKISSPKMSKSKGLTHYIHVLYNTGMIPDTRIIVQRYIYLCMSCHSSCNRCAFHTVYPVGLLRKCAHEQCRL